MQNSFIQIVLIIVVSYGFLGGRLFASKPPVTAMAFAPDGKTVIIGSQAGLDVLSYPELKKQKSIKVSSENIHDLAFSPNHKFLAVAGGIPAEEGIIEVLNWSNDQILSTYRHHQDTVTKVIWKNNSSFVTTSLDHQIALWDLHSKLPKKSVSGHSRGVTSFCFLPEKKQLVSASNDQNIRLWKMKTFKVVRTLNNHQKEIHNIALRPQVKGLPMIASVSSDRTVRLWQPTIGRMVRFAKLKSVPLAVTWLTDGSQIAVSTTTGHLLLIDPNNAKIRQDFSAIKGWAYAIAAHPDDGSLLIGGSLGQLKRIVPASTVSSN